MPYHVLVITSSYLSQYIKDTLVPPENVEFRYVEYKSFSELENLYFRNEAWADGILTTGIVVQTVLERAAVTPLKPILSLDTDNESFYRIPLSLLIENRSLDPERIIFDVFVNVAPEVSVLSLVEPKNIRRLFPEFFKWLSKATLDDLEHVEQATLATIKKLWEDNKIDLVICRYSSLVPKLKKLNIPCVFASGTDERLQEVLKSLLSKIKMEKITSHAPAVIKITPRDTKDHLWTGRMEESLEKAIHKFLEKNDLRLLTQKQGQETLLLTEKVVVSYLTEGFTNNNLAIFLQEEIDFNLNVSYGIGNTLEEAMRNAKKAYVAAGISRDSFLVDEEEKLIGPLNREKEDTNERVVTPKMKEIANKSGLSTATIHRISRLVILLGRREVTSAELAENFNMTLRGANRILKKLEEAGFAKTTVQKSSHLKGRPTKIYHLHLE